MMSDAKKCDRCGRYYMKGIENGFRPSIEGLRIFGVRYVSGANQNIDNYDLCPKCAVKVWEYISKYDEPTENHEAVEPVLNKEPIIMSEDVVKNDIYECEKGIVNCDTIVERSDNISHLKEMYGMGMSSRNITITYWPNFDTYLMTALVSSNNVEHRMVKGDVDYETFAWELLTFFGHLDTAYGDDEKECDDE